MRTKLKINLLLIFMVSGLSAQDVSHFFANAHTFFEKNVIDGRVRYAHIKEYPMELTSLVNDAKKIAVTKADADNYKAFWINAYNLLVIQGVVNNYPIASPLDVNGFFDKLTYEVGGETITLNAIENKLLRGNFPEEARFHFVLVCAGLGCPPIINAAYMPSSLEMQLQKQTEKALNDDNFIRFKKNKVAVSQIFEWYKGDFEQNGKTLIQFINTYRTEKLPEDGKVSYYPYDWTLNEVN